MIFTGGRECIIFPTEKQCFFKVLDIPRFFQERSAIPPVGSADSPLNGAFP